MVQVQAKPRVPTHYEGDFYLWCFDQAELLRLRRQRGQLAVRGVDDEPRAAPVALQMLVPMRGTSACFSAAEFSFSK